MSLVAARTGKIDILAAKYCWTRFPGAEHYCISLFTPETKNASYNSNNVKVKKPAGPQMFVWLVALERLPGCPQHLALATPAPGTAAQSAPECLDAKACLAPLGSGAKYSNTSSVSNGNGPQLYLPFVMCQEKGQLAVWQSVGPEDLKQKRKGEPPHPLPLQARKADHPTTEPSFSSWSQTWTNLRQRWRQQVVQAQQRNRMTGSSSLEWSSNRISPACWAAEWCSRA